MLPILITLLVTAPVIAVGTWLYLRRGTHRPQTAARTHVVIRLRNRLGWVAVAFFLALVSCIQGFPFIWLFPMGLGLLFWPKTALNGVFLFLGYVVYLALVQIALSQSRRTRFFIVYAILLATLALNVAGCHDALNRFHDRF